MSLELENLDLSSLENLEYGQFIKDQINPMGKLPAGTITDPGLVQGAKSISDKSDGFDKSMVKVTKNKLTDDVVDSDKNRDVAISAYLASVELGMKSDNPAEREAAENLYAHFKSYGGSKIASMNLQKETNALDNMIADLEGNDYKDDVALLNIGKYVARMKTANNAFKAIFEQRLKDDTGKPVYDALQLRKELNTAYTDFCGYVLFNAKIHGTDQFKKVLDILNAARKYYADLLAVRKGKKKAKKGKDGKGNKEGNDKEEPIVNPEIGPKADPK